MVTFNLTQKLFTAGVAAVLAGNVCAQPEVQLNLPYYKFADPGLDTRPGGGLGLGYRFDNPWGVEATASMVPNEYSGGTGSEVDVDFLHYQLNGLYHFAESDRLHPFWMVGVGQMETDFDGTMGDSDTLASTLGVGFKYDMTDNWQFRTDGRWFYTDEGRDNLFAVNVGIAYLFGSRSETAPTRTTAPVRTERDSDNDGVADGSDRCPGTPMGVAVDARGCSRDDDGDGVANYEDRCPDTRAGLKVDEQGCPVTLEETVSIELEVYFDTNSAEVRRSYYSEIRRVADFLEQYDNTQAVIEGHTDARGAAAYNKALSQRRADAVKAVLVTEMGIAPARVEAIGYGEQRLLRTGDSPQAHEDNRRVVAEISTRVEKPVTEP